MYFPDTMNVQYFLFDTYPGYFILVLPIALVVSVLYGILRFRKDNDTSRRHKIISCIFVCYMTGLFCLVVFLTPIQKMWYHILYHADSGITMRFFTWWDVNLMPDFWHHMDDHMIGNFVMFVPFGILYPLTRKKPTIPKSILAGLLCTLTIEICQPIMGRAFDINDVILNTIGVAVGTALFWVGHRWWSRS